MSIWAGDMTVIHCKYNNNIQYTSATISSNADASYPNCILKLKIETSDLVTEVGNLLPKMTWFEIFF